MAYVPGPPYIIYPTISSGSMMSEEATLTRIWYLNGGFPDMMLLMAEGEISLMLILTPICAHSCWISVATWASLGLELSTRHSQEKPCAWPACASSALALAGS